ncbi:hypothetical protein B5P45_04000 [Phyllobacterium zundukense]|uniref:Bacteriocin n=1 Tax=Phyllobacterium zundukense TaxID=1867719 RepID=A0A2N9W300_9HYPH|nr:hypothetical protein [Phyllobacterium zundukense]ATU94115.1 hypothetical protein BLM14_20250 [Phyllobacterium zundukense]PIO46118.1 hypothetical protein B5P45_04000 [Phyllobacterium zundukense]
MREIDVCEMEQVAGGLAQGPFETVGGWMDNPFTAAGSAVDWAVGYFGSGAEGPIDWGNPSNYANTYGA